MLNAVMFASGLLAWAASAGGSAEYALPAREEKSRHATLIFAVFIEYHPEFLSLKKKPVA
ncbi:hypothetical protein [Pantoea agglomerans]|uniref:hypothetical protein n=1 Tax=Enterobacter agglomerans TaxID=549 RepID=UPI003965BD1B